MIPAPRWQGTGPHRSSRRAIAASTREARALSPSTMKCSTSVIIADDRQLKTGRSPSARLSRNLARSGFPAELRPDATNRRQRRGRLPQRTHHDQGLSFHNRCSGKSPFVSNTGVDASTPPHSSTSSGPSSPPGRSVEPDIQPLGQTRHHRNHGDTIDIQAKPVTGRHLHHCL